MASVDELYRAYVYQKGDPHGQARGSVMSGMETGSEQADKDLKRRMQLAQLDDMEAKTKEQEKENAVNRQMQNYMFGKSGEEPQVKDMSEMGKLMQNLQGQGYALDGAKFLTKTLGVPVKSAKGDTSATKNTLLSLAN